MTMVYAVDFEPGAAGVVELVIRGADDPYGEFQELVRVGMDPQSLDALLTDGRERLWEALGVHAG